MTCLTSMPRYLENKRDGIEVLFSCLVREPHAGDGRQLGHAVQWLQGSYDDRAESWILDASNHTTTHMDA